MNDKISIIVCIYRVEQYLRQCIESILNQTYKNLEIILVDDGSDDNCPMICDEYSKLDSRVKVIHKENGGIDSARKAGILASTGKYIGYVDGDDWIEKNMYEILYHLITNNNVKIVESAVIDSAGTSHTVRTPYIEEGKYEKEDFDKYVGPCLLYSGMFFNHGVTPYLVTKIFERELLIRYQMLPDPSDNIVDDTMCTFPCILEARSLYITYQAFYHYRIRVDSAKRELRKDIVNKIKPYYPYWKDRFSGAIITDNIKRQIYFFTMYLLISKSPEIFDKKCSTDYLIPYGGVSRNARLVLYGAGMVGIHLYNYLNMNGNVVYWADKKYESLAMDEVKSPYGILGNDYDYVIISIMSERAVKSAIYDLVELGVPRNKIRWISDEYINNPSLLLEGVI